MVTVIARNEVTKSFDKLMMVSRVEPQSLRSQRLLRVLCALAMTMLLASTAFADVVIETSVSRSRVAVGEEFQFDIIVSNAQGKISRPAFSSIEGFSSYSQGQSQEITIINGKTSSRSIFSYVLIPNSVGRKKIGPFEIQIAGKTYKVAPVEVDVVQSTGSPVQMPAATASQGPVSAPNPRALPTPGVDSRDIFVKTWLDKDEVYVNEPAILTYTLYTRLSATYRGFEAEPITTGFWVEDFPPEKTIRRTEQFINGSRYVAADVRKTALFPTEPGVFTVDTGVLSAAVEIRSQDNFDSFFSYNVFGRRSTFPSTIISEVVEKSLPADKVTLVVKALPENGKPANFNGAVGNYIFESSMDKKEVDAGTPVTFRMRVSGQGNINTLQPPELGGLEDFKVYDSSISTNISKNRLIVEGEKVKETVIVPKKAGTYTIPSLKFSYFDPRARAYKELRTVAHTLKVNPGVETEEALPPSLLDPSAKEDVEVVAKDIRYIKTQDDGKFRMEKELYRQPLYWIFNLALVLAALLPFLVPARGMGAQAGLNDARSRGSHRAARRRLKAAARRLDEGKKEEFYAETSKALYGYFADKLGIPAQGISIEELERAAGEKAGPEFVSRIRRVFDELAMGRFASIETDTEEMKKVYGMADEMITSFEKVKLR